MYLDTAATAKYKSSDDIVINTITNAMKEYWQNPSSLYATNVKDTINMCRKQVADFIGAKSDEIYFTSGASESNNWAIRGWVDNEFANAFGFINIITTPIEHKSIIEAVRNENLCANIEYCGVDEFGIIDYQKLNMYLKYHKYEPTLVSIGMANNEIGTLQDVKRISKLVHRYNGILHVDATQALPYIPINVEELGIDLLSASGHKISSVLKGIGFLYKRNSINIQPLIYGSQESGLRGGTENTFNIIGMAKALELCDKTPENIQELCEKRDYFIKMLKSKFSKSGFNIKLNGHPTKRLPNNINITFPHNITGEALLYTLDINGVFISTGSACNSKFIEPSYVLKAIGLSDEQAMKTIRISLPNDITYEEINWIVNEIDKAIKIIEA